ncbi:MAG TPA: PAS domain-containing protein, partial [Phenylobacterium sp.]|nr:PAS domain-containing protein [Phenylobacterium sp.]
MSERLAALEAEVEELRARLAEASAPGQAPLVDVLLRDNARRREVEQQLAFAQEWIQLAQEAGGVAAYTLDLDSRHLTWSASNFALWGWTPNESEPDIERWLQTIHPEDRADAQQVLMAAIQQGREVRHEFRIVLPGGEIRHIQDRARVILDAKGQPRRLVGLNVDVTDLKRVQHTLEHTEARYRRTFEHAAVGVAHVSPSGRFLAVNPRLCEILGYPEEELLAITFQEITHPDDLEPDLELARALLAGEIDRFEMEKRYLKPSGEIVWADLTASLQRDADGTPLNYISVINDIGGRKQAEERLNFLFGELAHRSKNLLTVILSAVRQIGQSAASVEDFQAGISDRVVGLAAAQDLLTRHDYAGAPVSDLVVGQLSAFVTAADRRVKLSGPPITLRAAATHSLGLALHELATNACKPGALSRSQGEVSVVWSLLESRAEPLRFQMTWTERGGPLVMPPT